MTHHTSTPLPTIFFLSLVVVVLFCMDLCSGSVWLWPFAGLSEMESHIMLAIRLPKALTAILAGASLSVAGLLMQTLFRNPLAGPYILGVSSGAGLGVACVTLLNLSLWLPSWCVGGGLCLGAVAGSLLVMSLVLWVARRVRDNVSLLIVGMMFGAIAGALVNVLQNFANPDALKLFVVWTFGSLNSVGWTELWVMTVVLVAATVLLLGLVKPLNGLLLGDGYAQGVGVPVERTRRLIVWTTCLLAGGVTAFCGPIAFIGVAVPHVARGLFRTTDHRLTVPVTALLGAALLLLCDILCSLFTYPLPVSTMSALFAAPVIVSILLRK